MSSQLKRKIDSLIALYYYVARPRKWIGKLDAATEITVAVCDLFPPPLDAEQFWLSDVQLLRDGQEIEAASSLTRFDIENGIRDELCKVAPSKGIDLGGGMGLRVPQTVREDACEELCHFWKEILPTFESDIFQDLTSHSHRTTDSQTAESRDYLLSLRHIFDSIVGGNEDAYTLQVSRTGETFKVSKGQSVDFALGYWLPRSTLFKLVSENVLTSSEVVELETILKPARRREVLISQSHSNVHSRKASLVRNQLNRSEYLKSRYPPSKDEIIRRVGELEKKVWDDPPHTIVMMPLVSYGCCDSDQYAVTTAHCYVAVRGEPDVEELMLRRYRALRTFEDGMYQRYCQTIAGALARYITSSRGPEYLEEVTSMIAAQYYIPSRISVDASKPDGQSLYKQLSTFREAVQRDAPAEGSRNWGSRVDLALHSLTVKWDRKSRSTEEADVLALLNQNLELEAGREWSGFRGLRESFHVQFDKLTSALGEAQRIKDLLISKFEYPRAPWQDVFKMRAFHSTSSDYACQSDGPADLPGVDPKWGFLKAHKFHLDREAGKDQCKEGVCKAEAVRRAAYMFGAIVPRDIDNIRSLEDCAWPPDLDKSENVLAFVEFCALLGVSPGFWIKRSCEKGSEKRSPSIAAIVTLLFLCGARVNASPELLKNYPLRVDATSLPKWELSLSGIANLSKEGANRSQIALIPHNDKIIFELGEGIEEVMNYSQWFEDTRKKAQSRPAGNSSTQDIAAAYMYDEGILPAHNYEGAIGDIVLKLKGKHLLCIWHRIKLIPRG